MGQGIGAAVRSARLRRGLSLDVVAGQAGRSKSWLSKVERGLLPLERSSDITALARALQVAPADLTGQPYPLPDDAPGLLARDALPAIRLAAFDRPTAQVRPAAELAAELATVTELRTTGRSGEALAAVAPLLGRLRAAATGPEHIEVSRMLVVASHYASRLCCLIGQHDLALLLATLTVQVAAEVGDPALVGLAVANHSYRLALLPTAAYGAAVDVASNAADALASAGGSEAAAAVGQLQLAAAWAAASLGDADEVSDRLAAAWQLAGRVEGSTLLGQHFMFGPDNVVLHRMACAGEAGRPDDVIAAAASVDLDRVPYAERASAGWRDLGLAYAALARDEQAVAALRRAEALDPLLTELHPLVREAVAGMAGRAQRAAVGRDLRGLACRMGLPH